MKITSNIFGFVICTLIFMSSSVLLAKTTKKSTNNKSTINLPVTQWLITCPGSTPTCYAWGGDGGMVLIEPGGPPRRKQVSSFDGGSNEIIANNIFLYTNSPNTATGLGYYPASVSIFQSDHANVEVGLTTSEYTTYSSWFSALP